MSSKQLVYLLLLILISSRVENIRGYYLIARQDHYLKWPTACSSYTKSVGQIPRSSSFDGNSSITEEMCRDLCSERAECGGFVIYNNTDCTLKNINAAILENIFPNRSLVMLHDDFNWISKNCTHDSSNINSQCDYADGLVDTDIDERFRFMSIGPAYNVTTEECRSYCSLYNHCMSVTHKVDTFQYPRYPDTWCYLYNITSLVAASAEYASILNTSQDRPYNYTLYDKSCDPLSIPADTTTVQPTDAFPIVEGKKYRASMYQTSSIMANRVIRGNSLVIGDVLTVRSGIECAAKCTSAAFTAAMGVACKGFNYKHETNTCELLETNFKFVGVDLLEVESGFRHYWDEFEVAEIPELPEILISSSGMSDAG